MSATLSVQSTTKIEQTPAECQNKDIIFSRDSTESSSNARCTSTSSSIVRVSWQQLQLYPLCRNVAIVTYIMRYSRLIISGPGHICAQLSGGGMSGGDMSERGNVRIPLEYRIHFPKHRIWEDLQLQIFGNVIIPIYHIGLRVRLRVARGSKFWDPTRPGKSVTRPDPLILRNSWTRPDPQAYP